MGSSLPRIAPCPVCKMPVKTAECEFTAERGGIAYFFCAEGCRDKFLGSSSCRAKPKGWWGRYLDRLARANEEQFGCSGPKCH